MREKINKLLPIVFTLIIIAIPTFFILHSMIHYREMKMWGDVLNVKDYIDNNFSTFGYVMYVIMFFSVIGIFIKKMLGWILSLHIFYFFLVYTISVNINFSELGFYIAYLVLIIVIMFANSKPIIDNFRVKKNDRLTINLIVLIISMIVVLSTRNLFILN